MQRFLLSPEQFSNELKDAVVYLNEGRYNQAIDKLERLKRKDAGRDGIGYCLGVAYR